jgi:hypothetical protein
MTSQSLHVGLVFALCLVFIGAASAQQYVLTLTTVDKKCGGEVYLGQAARAGRCITQGFNSVMYICPNLTVYTWSNPFADCSGTPSNMSVLAACTNGNSYECIDESQIETKLAANTKNRVFTNSNYEQSSNCTAKSSPYLVTSFYEGCYTNFQGGFIRAGCSNGVSTIYSCVNGCSICPGDDVYSTTNCTSNRPSLTVCNTPKNSAGQLVAFTGLISGLIALAVSMLWSF